MAGLEVGEQLKPLNSSAVLPRLTLRSLGSFA